MKYYLFKICNFIHKYRLWFFICTILISVCMFFVPIFRVKGFTQGQSFFYNTKEFFFNLNYLHELPLPNKITAPISIIICFLYIIFSVTVPTIFFIKKKSFRFFFLIDLGLCLAHIVFHFSPVNIFKGAIPQIGFFLFLIFGLIEFSYWLINRYFKKHPYTPPPKQELQPKTPALPKLTDKQRIAQLEQEVVELKTTIKKDE